MVRVTPEAKEGARSERAGSSGAEGGRDASGDGYRAEERTLIGPNTVVVDLRILIRPCGDSILRRGRKLALVGIALQGNQQTS